jgi:hypothetical protein
MSAKSPLTLVKEKFGDKAKLVESLEKLVGEDLWVARTNKDKGLAHVSNAKLMRLHAVFSEVKEKFGTREKLIEAILDLEKRGKDGGLRERLRAWPVPRLYDAFRSTSKKVRDPAKAKAQAKPMPAQVAKKAAIPPKKAAAKSAKIAAEKAPDKTTEKAVEKKKPARKTARS